MILPLQQADVGEECLSIFIQNVKWIGQHLVTASLSQCVLWDWHQWAEVKRHRGLSQ